MNTQTIQNTRDVIQKTESDSERVIAFIKLLKDAALTWEDLLNCLQYKVIIEEQTAFKLHDFSEVEIPESGPIRDVIQWRNILSARGINTSDIIDKT